MLVVDGVMTIQLTATQAHSLLCQLLSLEAVTPSQAKLVQRFLRTEQAPQSPKQMDSLMDALEKMGLLEAPSPSLCWH